MRFAKIVFLVAGIWGLAVLLPMYFKFDTIGREAPPAITHPAFYYGFLGVALAWQIGFLLIAADPRRFRPMMAVGAVEKLSYAISVGVLDAQGRVAYRDLALGAAADLVLGILFVAAFVATRSAREPQGP